VLAAKTLPNVQWHGLLASKYLCRIERLVLVSTYKAGAGAHPHGRPLPIPWVQWDTTTTKERLRYTKSEIEKEIEQAVDLLVEDDCIKQGKASLLADSMALALF